MHLCEVQKMEESHAWTSFVEQLKEQLLWQLPRLLQALERLLQSLNPSV